MIVMIHNHTLYDKYTEIKNIRLTTECVTPTVLQVILTIYSVRYIYHTVIMQLLDFGCNIDLNLLYTNYKSCPHCKSCIHHTLQLPTQRGFD